MSAALTVLAPLESLRSLSGSPKTIIFNAQLWMGHGQPPLICQFRYFNASDMAFSDLGFYFLHANILKMHNNLLSHSAAMKAEDFNIIGDIVWLIPIDEIDKSHVCRYAWVTANGITVNCNQAEGVFDMDINQYLQSIKDLDAADHPVFPVCACYDLSSMCYKNKKPHLRNGRYVVLTGYLTRTINSGDGTLNRFVVDIENVTHLGQAPPPTAPTTSSSPVVSDASTKKLKFSFSQMAKARSKCHRTSKTQEPTAGVTQP